MSRIRRFREPPQPSLPLGHSIVHWDVLPQPVRERVLELWTQLLTQHLSHVGIPPEVIVPPALPSARDEEGR
jgi:hypothetical protein